MGAWVRPLARAVLERARRRPSGRVGARLRARPARRRGPDERRADGRARGAGRLRAGAALRVRVELAPAPPARVVAEKGKKLMGGSDAVLIVEDTALLKQGKHSVGVERQHAGSVGKTTNCQTLVSLTFAQGEVPMGLALRLYVPEGWASDAARRPRGKVPAAVIFRLEASSCPWSSTGSGRPVRASRPCSPTQAMGRRPSSWPAAPPADARAARWARRGHSPSRTPPRARVADGPIMANAQHLPGEAAWRICERRTTGERKDYLTNHPAQTSLLALLRAIKARWSCEQAHHQSKEELGLDHFEGRSSLGLHDHALLTMIAFAFLQHRRLIEAQTMARNARHRDRRMPGGKTDPHDPRAASHPRPTAPALTAGDASHAPRRTARRRASTMSAL